MNLSRRTYHLSDNRASAVVLTIDGEHATVVWSGRLQHRDRSGAASLLASYRRLRQGFPTVYRIVRLGDAEAVWDAIVREDAFDTNTPEVK